MLPPFVALPLATALSLPCKPARSYFARIALAVSVSKGFVVVK